MTRFFEFSPGIRRGVGAVGAAGQVLLGAAALFAAMSLYGWRQGLHEQALNIGLLSVALFCTFLLLLLARGWVVPLAAERIRGLTDD